MTRPRSQPNWNLLRLSSIDPAAIDEDLWRLLAEEPRLMPYLHLSLQAGSDLILKRMKRRHLRQDAIDFCAQVRRLRPDVAFGADIIAAVEPLAQRIPAEVAELLTDSEIEAMHERIEWVLENRVFPGPGSRYEYPWPIL